MVASSPRRTWRDIPGWFGPADHAMFQAVLRAQAVGPPGDLVEIGVFEGRSAVVIGAHRRDDERFVVVDPFGDPVVLGIESPGSRRAGRNYFTGLSRSTFEQNYLSVHDELPVVVQALSRDIVDHVAPGSVRFLHIDGSHEYDDVVGDTQAARTILQSDGVVVFDDYRKAAAPGVAAAVWQAVARDGLVPVVVTRQKLYGTYGDPAPLAAAARTLAADPRWALHEHRLATGTVLRVASSGKGHRSTAKAPAPPDPSLRRRVGRIARRLRGQDS